MEPVECECSYELGWWTRVATTNARDAGKSGSMGVAACNSGSCADGADEGKTSICTGGYFCCKSSFSNEHDRTDSPAISSRFSSQSSDDSDREHTETEAGSNEGKGTCE